MKTQAAFKRPDGVVELNAKTAIDLHVAFIIHPRHPKDNGSFRFHNSFVNISFYEFRMLFDRGFQCLHYFLNGLMKLRLARIHLFYFRNYIFDY